MNKAFKIGLLAGSLTMAPLTLIAGIYEGKVISVTTKKPLVGIPIRDSKGKVVGMTDAEGRFKVEVDEQRHHFISFSGIGYTRHKQPLEGLKSAKWTIQLEENSMELSDVTITATRTEKHLRDIPVLTQVVGRKQIERIGTTDFRDVLSMALPGVEFSMHGNSQQVSVQGFSGKYLLFLLDGEPMSSQNMDNIDFSRIDVNEVERIEFIPGSGSALYGSRAVGGVINIITRQASTPWQAQVGAHYSHPHQRLYEARAGVVGDSYKASIGGTLSQLDAYTIGKEVGAVKGSKTFNLNSQISYSFNPKLRIKARLSGGRHTLHNVPGIEDFHSYTHRANLGAIWQLSPTQSLDLSTSLDHARRDQELLKESVDRATKKKIPAGTSQYYKDLILNARLQYNLSIGKSHTLNVGSEFFSDKLEARLLDPSKPAHSINNTVLYGQHEWRILPSLRLAYGARLDKHSRFGLHFTPKGSLLLNLKQWDARLSYAEGFIAPTLTELNYFFIHPGRAGGPDFLIKGNSNLQPELSRRFTVQTGYNSRYFSASVSAFTSSIHNKITYVQQRDEHNAMYLENRNVPDKSIIKGVEAQARVQTDLGLYLQTSYSYTDDKRIVPEGGENFNLSGTRPHALTAMLGYSYTRGNYELGVNLVGRWYSDVTYALVKSKDQIAKEKKAGTYKTQYYNYTEPSYGNLRLVTSFKYRKAYTLQLGVDNLLDYRPNRATLYSALTPGRTLFASFYIDIDRIFNH